MQETAAKEQGGIVTIEYLVLNQDQTTVMSASMQFLMRPAGVVRDARQTGGLRCPR